jgi:hypothetical protein
MTTQQNPGPDAPSPAPGPDVVGVDPREPAAPRKPADPRKFDAPKGVEGSGRYAYYDTTLGKYVGGVHDTKAKAKEAGKGAASGQVVEV